MHDINDDGTQLSGIDPGFIDAVNGDYRLLEYALLANAGTELNEKVLPDHAVLHQYIMNEQASAPRTDNSVGALDAVVLPADSVMNELVARLDGLIASGDVNGPSASQLYNRLEQVQRHWDAGRVEQAASTWSNLKTISEQSSPKQ